MLCAAVDIGSNTTRVLVAEPQEGQLRKVMEQRAYTRFEKDSKRKGKITDAKIDELAEVVTTQVRLAEELGAQAIKIVATAAIREAKNSSVVAKRIGEAAGLEVEVLSEQEEGRLAFIGATKTLGHPVDGDVGVVDVGGGSSEIILGTVAAGVREVRSFKIGSGAIAEEFLTKDPPSAAEIRSLRDYIDDFFEDVEVDHPGQAVAVGGSATSLRTLVGAVLEYETLERAVRVLTGDPIAEVAKRFELDQRRVRILPAGVLILEKLSELLGQPLQIGKGGLREGIILDLLHGAPGPRRSPPSVPLYSPGMAKAPSDERSRGRRSLRRCRGEGGRVANRRTARAQPRVCSTPPRSSRCTTCGSPPGGCEPRSRHSSPAFRASATCASCARSRRSPTRSASAATATSPWPRSRASRGRAASRLRSLRPAVESRRSSATARRAAAEERIEALASAWTSSRRATAARARGSAGRLAQSCAAAAGPTGAR